MNTRAFIVLGLMLLIPGAITLQIMRIQFLEGSELRALWGEQAIDYVPIPAERGHILDASDRILVSNSVSYSVIVDPLAPRTSRADLDAICATLARFTDASKEDYVAKIRNAPKGSRYVLLERGVSRQGHDALRELGIRGLILEEHFRRRYNYETLAAHTLGYVNHNVDGMMGLESSFNSMLKGTEGEQQVQRDRNGRIRAVVGAPRRRPVAGNSIRTTIDARIQAIVEEELMAGVLRSRSNHGTVIIVDPETGAIKAMANYPTFNPNTPARYSDENRRDFAIADMIEPGSTFKLVTAVAATEQGVIKDNEIFHTPANGQKRIYGQMMRDHDPLGSIDFRNVIQKSSNIATSEIAMRLDKQTFYQYARNFGFGTPTGIDLPGEEAGRLQRPHSWSQVTLPWMSIGYEIQVTPLQMAMAYAAFANDGKLMRPYVVDEVIDERGNVVEKTRPHVVRSVVRPRTITDLSPIFESVLTEQGTAEFARVEGVQIAGKTGTAQKYIEGRYRTRYRASFVGFYPVDDPKYVCFVLMDEPRTSIYGGVVSGPVFRNITQRILALDERLHREEVVHPDSIQYVVPRLDGYSKDDAFVLLDQMKLRYDTEGKGTTIESQEPKAGTRIARRDKIVLTLTGGAP
jgi:cell division protein FtsI (penicillin-binding protein 3)